MFCTILLIEEMVVSKLHVFRAIICTEFWSWM